MYASISTHLGAMQPGYYRCLPCHQSGGCDGRFGGMFQPYFQGGGGPAFTNPAFGGFPWGTC